MAGQQRKCANCRYFRDAGLPGNGWCTHPKRQHSNDVKILVRAGELACRNSWGGDLFLSRFDDSMAASADADLPGDGRDDEVTSVVIPPAGGRPAEDRIVADRPAPRFASDDDNNDAARIEQDERARIMARGSRDALRHARERHSNRRNRATQQPGDQDADDSQDAHDRVVAHQARFSDRFLTPGPGMGRPGIDEAPVPRAEVERRMPTPPDRFDTVPDVDPDFELPGLRAATSAKVEPSDASHAPEPDAAPPTAPAQPNAYEHVLQRARRIREHKHRQAAQPLRHADLGVDRIVPPETETDAIDERDAQEWASPDHEWDDSAGIDQEVIAEPWDDSHERAEIAWEDDAGTGQDLYADEADADADFDDSYVDDEPDDEMYAPAPAPRRATAGGWFSRLNLRRRGHQLSHDDGMVTRHADWDAWTTVDNDTDEAEPWDHAWGSDEAEVEEPVVPRSHRAPLAPAAHWDNEWNDPTQDTSPQEVIADAGITYIEDAAEPEPRAAAAVAQPSRETWHRRRSASVLPDLDDNLFDAQFERRRATSTPPAFNRVTGDEPLIADHEPVESEEAGSPRDSWFRAARFRDWADEQPHAQPANVEVRGDIPAARRLPEMQEHGLDLRELVARGGELLDMTIDVAPDVPRECRTCRSFRSADGGARGWCTNEWAFTHRRMVNEDDLACETSIGCWWLPADRYIIVETEDGYASPTPRIDEMIARREPPADTRRISGD